MDKWRSRKRKRRTRYDEGERTQSTSVKAGKNYNAMI
jgi:hypothetical protein